MGISDAERERRRELIQQHKPWLSSTGASTAAGKRRTRMNAFKTGFHSRDPKPAEQVRRVQRELQEAERRARIFLAIAGTGMLTACAVETEVKLAAPTSDLSEHEANFSFAAIVAALETLTLTDPDGAGRWITRPQPNSSKSKRNWSSIAKVG